MLWFSFGSALALTEPVWFDNHAKPKPEAYEALRLLGSVALHGLDPDDYQYEALAKSFEHIEQSDQASSGTIAQLDQLLTQTMQLYLSDLHHGRIDPRQLYRNYSTPKIIEFDAAHYLRTSLANNRLVAAAQNLEPKVALYANLQAALLKYRSLIDHPAWHENLPPFKTNRAYAGLQLLAARLVALGDLDASKFAFDERELHYEGALRDAVKSFQMRHGLPAQGNLGRLTLAQLEVTPAVRVRQIELMLERLRWTPLLQAPRMIVINVPEFTMRAYEVLNRKIRLQHEMKVIVGTAAAARTPLFSQDLRFIEFSPFWNVPSSIARAELVPRLRKDPGFFRRDGFEFVDKSGLVTRTVSNAHLDAVLEGELRIRQTPGPRNALGDVKFVFPNTEQIFLHHTPNVRLFDSARRDFSHGCIRVERPVDLAKFALAGMPGWNEQRIRAAMSKGVSSTISLDTPVRVLIAYGTALVRDKKVYFFDDLYGYDRLLDQSLRRASSLRRTASSGMS